MLHKRYEISVSDILFHFSYSIQTYMKCDNFTCFYDIQIKKKKNTEQCESVICIFDYLNHNLATHDKYIDK